MFKRFIKVVVYPFGFVLFGFGVLVAIPVSAFTYVFYEITFDDLASIACIPLVKIREW